MRRLFFFLMILLCPTFVVAQFDIPSNPGGNNTGTGGFSGGGSSQAPSTGMSNDPTALTSMADTPTFQDFRPLGDSSFIGVPNTSTFIGTEQSFDPSTSTSSRRPTTTTSTVRRTTTASRTSINRANTLTSRSTADQRSVRPVTSPGFEFLPMGTDARAAAIQTQIARTPNFQAAPVAVRMEGNVVTLTGTVATPQARKLAEQLVRLDPGVRTVNNQLTVQQSQSSTANGL